MPRVKKEPERLVPGGRFVGSTVVDIQVEISRWNGVMESHALQNDMQVAQMLLDCYDFIGSSSLTWTNKGSPKADDNAILQKQRADEDDEAILLKLKSDEDLQSKEAVLLLKQKAEEVQPPQSDENQSSQIENVCPTQTDDHNQPPQLDNDEPQQVSEALCSLRGNPPQSAAVVRMLKERTEDGQQTLKEIHAFMVINEPSPTRLSKRHQIKVQKELLAAVEEEELDDIDEGSDDSDDDGVGDFVTVKFDGDYEPQMDDESDEGEPEPQQGRGMRKRKRMPTANKAELNRQRKTKKQDQSKTQPLPKKRGRKPQPKKEKEPVPKKLPKRKTSQASPMTDDVDPDDEEELEEKIEPWPISISERVYTAKDCTICGATFDSEESLKKHCQAHQVESERSKPLVPQHGINPYKRKLHSARGSYEEDVTEQDMYTESGKVDAEQDENSDSMASFNCTICTLRFHSEEEFMQHSELHAESDKEPTKQHVADDDMDMDFKEEDKASTESNATPGTHDLVLQNLSPNNQHTVLQKSKPNDQPKVLQNPTPNDQPKVLQNPSSNDQPKVLQNPSPNDQPEVHQKPAPNDQPKVLQNPTPNDQPKLLHKPVPKNQPTENEVPTIQPTIPQTPVVKLPIPSVYYCCSKCPARLISMKEVQDHCKTHIDNDQTPSASAQRMHKLVYKLLHNCTTCNTKFVARKDLEEHKKKIHPHVLESLSTSMQKRCVAKSLDENQLIEVPFVNKQMMQHPSAQKSVLQKPPGQKPLVQNPSVQNPLSLESSVKKPLAQKSSSQVHRTPAQKSLVEGCSSKESSVLDPPLEEPQEPLIPEPSVQEPLVQKPCAQESSVKVVLLQDPQDHFKKPSTIRDHPHNEFRLLYCCKVCKANFESQEDFTKHYIASHTDRSTPRYLKLEDISFNQYKCLKCNFISTEKTHGLKVERERVFEPLYDCKICGERCESEHDFQQHYYKHHTEGGTTIKDALEVQYYKCTRCNIVTKNKKCKHFDMYHVPRTCERCGKTLANSTVYYHHKQWHKDQDTVHQCEKCGKIFGNNYNLKRHIRRHSKLRPHVCQVCGKSFKDLGQCNRHTFMHSHKKDHYSTCPVCGKRVSYLRIHMKVHSEDKEFKCHMCPKETHFRCDYISHMKKAHDVEIKKQQKAVLEFD